MLPSIFGENLFDDFFADPFGMMPAVRGGDPLYGKHARNLMKTDVREKAVYLVMALRNFLIPVLAMLVLMALPMDVQDKLCVLVYLACPCATLTTIYSIQTDTHPELCARSVLFSTITFAVSLPVVIVAGQFLFGV